MTKETLFVDSLYLVNTFLSAPLLHSQLLSLLVVVKNWAKCLVELLCHYDTVCLRSLIPSSLNTTPHSHWVIINNFVAIIIQHRIDKSPIKLQQAHGVRSRYMQIYCKWRLILMEIFTPQDKLIIIKGVAEILIVWIFQSISILQMDSQMTSSNRIFRWDLVR